MSEIATANINNFASRDSTGRVSPESDFEQFITLNIDQIQDLIDQSVQKTVQPLQDRIESLESIVASQGEEIAALRLKLTCLEQNQDKQSENQLIQLQLIHKLKEEIIPSTTAPTVTESERIERIEKLCTDAPKHEISLSELRGRLGIDTSVLSRLLKRIDADMFYLRKSTLDKRVRYLCLRPEVR